MGQGRAYHPEEDEFIRNMVREGWDDEAIGARLGRGRVAIRIRRWRLGIGCRDRARSTYQPRTIETPRGVMTRRQASAEFGIPFGTLCRRIWEGRPPEFIFNPERMPNDTPCVRRVSDGRKPPRRKKGAGHTRNAHFEPYAVFKARRQAERAAKAAADPVS